MKKSSDRSSTFDYTALARPVEEAVELHGPTPKGLWDGVDSAEKLVKRCDALFEMIPDRKPYSLLDVGCGPGLLLGYMEARDWLDILSYHGIDISARMIELARNEWPGHSFEVRDILRDELPESSYDYVVLNGVFQSRYETPWDEMENFVKRLLVSAWSGTRHALAFNVMTIHVDWERPELFHWPVDSALAFCKAALSRHVTVRANYGLYEYTVEVCRTPRAASGPVPRRWLPDATAEAPRSERS